MAAADARAAKSTPWSDASRIRAPVRSCFLWIWMLEARERLGRSSWLKAGWAVGSMRLGRLGWLWSPRAETAESACRIEWMSVLDAIHGSGSRFGRRRVLERRVVWRRGEAEINLLDCIVCCLCLCSALLHTHTKAEAPKTNTLSLLHSSSPARERRRARDENRVPSRAKKKRASKATMPTLFDRPRQGGPGPPRPARTVQQRRGAERQRSREEQRSRPKSTSHVYGALRKQTSKTDTSQLRGAALQLRGRHQRSQPVLLHLSYHLTFLHLITFPDSFLTFIRWTTLLLLPRFHPALLAALAPSTQARATKGPISAAHGTPYPSLPFFPYSTHTKPPSHLTPCTFCATAIQDADAYKGTCYLRTFPLIVLC